MMFYSQMYRRTNQIRSHPHPPKKSYVSNPCNMKLPATSYMATSPRLPAGLVNWNVTWQSCAPRNIAPGGWFPLKSRHLYAWQSIDYCKEKSDVDHSLLMNLFQLVDPIVEPTLPSKGGEEASGDEPNNSVRASIRIHFVSKLLFSPFFCVR